MPVASVFRFDAFFVEHFGDGSKRMALLDMPKAEDRLYDAMMDLAKKKMTKEELADLFRDLVVEFNAKQKME